MSSKAKMESTINEIIKYPCSSLDSLFRKASALFGMTIGKSYFKLGDGRKISFGMTLGWATHLSNGVFPFFILWLPMRKSLYQITTQVTAST